jgi:hypothetical protein
MNGIGIGRLTSEHRRQSKRDESRSDHFFWVFFAYLECDSGCYYVEEGLNVRDHSHNQISEVDIYMDEGEEGEGHTTTSIIMLPLAPANPLPPRVYVNCAMTVLFKNKQKKEEVGLSSV